MADLCEINAAPRLIDAPVISCAVRRSPGRLESTHPALTTRDVTAIDEPAVLTRTRDDLGPARGVAIALLIALCFWALCFWCGIALLALW